MKVYAFESSLYGKSRTMYPEFAGQAPLWGVGGTGTIPPLFGDEETAQTFSDLWNAKYGGEK